MQPFTSHSGLVAVMDRADVDTDQIIPKQFLKRIERFGYERFLFFDWRFLEDGRENPDFELNQPSAQGASILVARRNFGCGTRRHCLLNGLDDIAMTLQHEEKITAYETAREARLSA